MVNQGAVPIRLVRHIATCGALMLLGYIGLFCLLQSPVLWYTPRPDPLRSLFPEPFGPLNRLFPDPWVNLDRTSDLALIAVPMYLVVLALITVPVLLLLRRLRKDVAVSAAEKKAGLRTIVGFTLVILFVLLIVRGLLTTDVYSYVWYSRILVDHGLSPYTHAPIEFGQPDPDGALAWVFWQREPAVYGPVWMLASVLAYKMGQLMGGSFSAQILSLRLLADAAHLINGWFVWSIAGYLAARPQSRLMPRTAYQVRSRLRHAGGRRFRTMGRPGGRSGTAGTIDPQAGKVLGVQFAALIFYLWNPLLLVEFTLSGHNDVVMLTFILAAILLYVKGRWQLGALALGLAVLVKLPALMFVPGYVWLVFWEGFRVSGASTGKLKPRLIAGAVRGAQAAGIIVASWVFLYLPFWEGPQTLRPLVSGPANRFFLHSFGADLAGNIPPWLATTLGLGNDFIASSRRFIEDNIRLLLMALLGLVAFAVTWRARTINGALTAWGWVAIVTVFAQGWFWPWYVSWCMVPAALTHSRRLRIASLVFAISALLLYIEQQVLGFHFEFFDDWSGTLAMGPPLVYILVSGLVALIRGRKPGMGEADRQDSPGSSKRPQAEAVGTN